MVVIAIIATTATIAIPQLISYWQTATLRAGAEELGGVLARARALAIASNQFVCVEFVSGAMRFRLGNSAATVCTAGTIWVGTGTDGSGRVPMSASTALSMTQAPVFSSLGAAVVATSFTVTDTHTGQAVPVTVSGTGRIRVGS